MSFINSSLNASVHVLRTFVMRLTLQLVYYNLLLPVLTYYATTDWRCLPLLATTKYGFLKLGYLTILLLMALAHPMHLF